MTLRLTEICDLAHRFVPGVAADERLYRYGAKSWWPAHEIGHFLVATKTECQQYMFGLDGEFLHQARIQGDESQPSRRYLYAIAKEIAAISISQRMLRRSGHVELADEEIQYTDEDTLECAFERWCKRAVDKMLRTHRLIRLPATFASMEALLARKAREVGTTPQHTAESGQR
jgi:hypothetical protein